MQSFVYFSQVDFEDTDLIITEPLFNFTTIQEAMAEILFEEYQFNSALRCNGRWSDFYSKWFITFF